MQGKHILYKQVEKYANAASFPTPGNEHLLYYAEDKDTTSVWNGTSYEVTIADPTAHTHTASEITDFDAEVSNNTSVAVNTAKVSNVTTNLSVGTKTVTTLDVNSSDGTNATLPQATITEAGLLSASDKVKINSTSNTNTGDQTITLTGSITGSGTGSFATTITNNAVTNAKAAQMAANTVKVNATTSLANAQDLAIAANTFLARLATGNIVGATTTQATALLNLFTSSLKGLTPASGGGTTNFLRADGTWNPAGAFLTTTVSPAQITANQNNYTTTGFAPKMFLRLDFDANRNITGFNATGFGARDYFVVTNISTNNCKLKANDGLSLAANRILLQGDLTIKENQSIIIIRDAVSNRWRTLTPFK